METHASAAIEDRWDDAYAAKLGPEELLVYRSNLIGADARVTKHGGGNTSAKLTMPDPLTGEPQTVLWVKASGGNLADITREGFARLYLDKLRGLRTRYRGPEDENAMVPLARLCAFALSTQAPSIDTPLHAFVPHAHVDHTHPDAVVALAATPDSEAMTREVFGEEIGWLPWRRPGFELGLWLQRFCAEHPNVRGVVLESHGLFTWGEDSRACYRATIETVRHATVWLAERARGRAVFGGVSVEPLPHDARRAIAAALLPQLRGLVSGERTKVAQFDDDEAVLEFVGSNDLYPLAMLGTACPDHFLRTKIRPMVLEFDPARETVDDLLQRLPPALEGYRSNYIAYYDRCARPDSPPMRDPNPVVTLIPGVGMLTLASDKTEARIAAAFYGHSIAVMRGASAVASYHGLPEKEAFGIEYWTLEDAKLQRQPKPKALAGRVALITGGAGGIGMATARRLMDEGAAVVICDIDRDALTTAEEELRAEYGRDALTGLWTDVTSEDAVRTLFRQAALAYGGIDICVANAGISSAAPVEETSLALWQRNMDLMGTGYFLTAREAFRMMKAQGTGGSIVFVASINGVAPAVGSSAYCTAKAAEVHLARCLALEGAPLAIRVNVVNPDAVLRNSRIWAGEWGEQRATAHKATREQLEAIYRDRSLLKRSVFPEDIAEAIAFFASDRSAKSTGNMLAVDAGHAAAFAR
jgi:rhamnulose-1-phosphate aldolase/alcohol dehydrogenase